MSNEQLMSDQRHEQLMKAAEETIGLMNMPGVDPSDALAKVAADNEMNDHEIELVANAVNNSKQLAYLQDAAPEDREKPFPLIDAEKVKQTNKLQPATNADQYTGGRYGTQETPSASAERAVDLGRDAIDTKDEMDKQASVSRMGDESFWNVPDADHEAILRQGWGLDAKKVAAAQLAQNQDPWIGHRKLSAYQSGIDEARTRENAARTSCVTLMHKAAVEFRRTDAPCWEPIAKAAAAQGADAEFLSLFFKAADLAERGFTPVTLAKTASRVYVTERERAVSDLLVQADAQWKRAADCNAAGAVLSQRYDQARAALLPKVGGVSFGSMAVDPGELSKQFGSMTEDYFGDPETMARAMKEEPSATGEEMGLRAAVKHNTRQEMRNTDTRDMVESLMKDSYIGTHNLPDVIDAYNQAISVNPRFGVAELTSYMRQHLATHGAVPLDLQLRARAPVRYTTPYSDEGDA